MLSLALLALVAAAADPALIFADQAPGSGQARIARFDQGAITPLAEVEIRRDFELRGRVTSNGRFAAFTSVPPDGEPTRRGALWRLDLSTGAVAPLAQDVSARDRPLFTRDGKRAVFVRILAIHEPAPEASKRGDLAEITSEIAAVDLASGQERRVLVDRGDGLNLAGTTSGEIVFYRVDRAGASFWRVSDQGGEPARIASLITGPFARDFSVRKQLLTFATLVDPLRHVYAIQQLDLDTRAVHTLATSPSDHLSPLGTALGVLAAWPAPGGDAIALVDALPPLVPAFDAREIPLEADASGRWIALRREESAAERLLVLTPGGLAEVPARPFFTVFGFQDAP